MTTTTDMQGQAAANVMEYRQTATATKFPIGGTREVVVQTLDVDRARAALARWDHAPIVQREVE